MSKKKKKKKKKKTTPYLTNSIQKQRISYANKIGKRIHPPTLLGSVNIIHREII